MAKNLKKEEANFIHQHYKGQEKLSIQKKIKERDAVEIPQSIRKMTSKIRI